MVGKHKNDVSYRSHCNDAGVYDFSYEWGFSMPSPVCMCNMAMFSCFFNRIEMVSGVGECMLMLRYSLN